jgi:hypothetical protein
MNVGDLIYSMADQHPFIALFAVVLFIGAFALYHCRDSAWKVEDDDRVETSFWEPRR